MSSEGEHSGAVSRCYLTQQHHMYLADIGVVWVVNLEDEMSTEMPTSPR